MEICPLAPLSAAFAPNNCHHIGYRSSCEFLFSRENGLKDNMYRCYLSLSGVTAKNKKYDEALRLAKRAQHLAKEKADKLMEADAVLQLGQVKIRIFSTHFVLLTVWVH